jgi:hypothetical protein
MRIRPAAPGFIPKRFSPLKKPVREQTTENPDSNTLFQLFTLSAKNIRFPSFNAIKKGKRKGHSGVLYQIKRFLSFEKQPDMRFGAVIINVYKPRFNSHD